MAILSYVLINAILSVVFAGLLTGIVGRPTAKNRGLAFGFYFVLLFLVNWAGALWIAPFGPIIYGAAILPMVLGALGGSLLIGVAAMTPFERDACETPIVTREKKSVLVTFGVFFWLTVIILFAMIVGGYMYVA